MGASSDPARPPGDRRERRLSAGEIVGILFLGLQAVSVAYAQTIPERFFCWAPYDIHTRYTIEVEIDGRTLSTREAQLRYRYSADGWEPRSIHNVFSMIAQYESTYGAPDGARVTVDYAINGRPPERWTWPPR